MVTRRVERYVQERFDAPEAELVLGALGDWPAVLDARLGPAGD